MIVFRIILAVFVALGAGYLAKVELNWSLLSSIILALIFLAVYGLTELELDLVTPPDAEEERSSSFGR